VMSEVSVSRRRRNPSARSALPLTCTLTRPPDSAIDVVEKARKIVSAEGSLSVGTCSISGIAYPSVNYLSQKVMSEVSVSRRHRSPSARSALAAYVYSAFSGFTFEVVEKHERYSGRKDLFPRKNFDAEGFPPSSPRGRVGLCRGKADPSLMTRLCV
jgi:hypothetical protein